LIRRQIWRPHYASSGLSAGQRMLRHGVRCRCGALILIVPCIACGCDPTQTQSNGE
jgi:hypothetical protein